MPLHLEDLHKVSDWLIDRPWWLAAVVAAFCLLIGFGVFWPLVLFI